LRSMPSARSLPVRPSKRGQGSRRVRREAVVAAHEARDQGGKIGPLLERTSGADQPTGAVERARLELAPKQPVPFVRPGQPQRAGLLAGEAKARVIGRVANQQHAAIAATAGPPYPLIPHPPPPPPLPPPRP